MKPNTENSEKGTIDTIGKVKRVVQNKRQGYWVDDSVSQTICQ